jgi:hypothetical protein
MSKHIISQDTPVAQLEQMVYDALTEINENMTNVAECNSMGNLYDMVMSGFTVYDEVVTIEMVKRIREEWVADNCEVEAVAEQVEAEAELTDGIRCGECGADVSDTEDGWCACLDVATTDGHSIRRAVAATVEEMKGMTDAEIHMWAGQWAQLALQASWNQMSQAMATVYSDENQRRIASK